MSTIETHGKVEAAASVTSRKQAPIGATIRNTYTVECYDKDRNLKWRVVRENTMATEGLNNLLDTCLRGIAAETDWFVGLVDNAGWTQYAAADTLTTHTGWSELPHTTAYSETVRQTWTANGAAAAGAVSNSTLKATFSINATNTVRGAFLCSVNTGTSGKLYGMVDFAAAKAVVDTDTLEVQVDASIS